MLPFFISFSLEEAINSEVVTLGLDEALKRTERLTRVNNVTALGGVVAIPAGFPEADYECFLWEDLHF